MELPNDHEKKIEVSIRLFQKHSTLKYAKKVLRGILSVLAEQKYFAVYSGKNSFYIGKIIKILDKEKVEIKFLEQGPGNSRW